MKNNNTTTFIIILGISIIVVFTSVITLNLLPDYESNSYYSKVEEDMFAKIESLEIKDGYLNVKTYGDPIEYCVKTTRSRPKVDNICWNKMENNQASISVLENTKYYVWIKDSEERISNYTTINSK